MAPTTKSAPSVWYGLCRSLGRGICVLAVLVWGGCGNPPPERVRSHITGRITASASSDYSGFRVLVVDVQGRSIDTLGQTETVADGAFDLTVTAPGRGVYPLTIWGRNGERRLASTDYVVADGDSATLRVEVPLNGRPIQVRSDENMAFTAYRHTVAQHRRTLTKRLETAAPDTNAMSRGVRQTSSMLWSLQETFPNTYASKLGAAGSLSLLAGWDDSLVVARARNLPPSSPRYVETARIARRATARMHGQHAALDLLDRFEARARTDAQRAGVQAARVQAFIDSSQSEAALSAAQRLRNEYPDTKWARWAANALYEVNTLLSGMPAPPFEARTVAGDSVSLRTLAGHPIVLEYFRPGSDLYHRQLRTRNALYRSTRADSVAFVAVSVAADTLLYDAFVQGRPFPGRTVIAAGGMDDPLVRRFNIPEVPTRVLIDASGRIVGRYPGAAFFTFQEDLVHLLRSP